MTDAELLTAAMTAARYEDSARFAVDVLHTDPEATRRCQCGLQPMRGDERAVCTLIVGHPDVAEQLAAIHSSLSGHSSSLTRYNAANWRATCHD